MIYPGNETHSDFLPVVVFHLEGTEMMLQRDNEAMTGDKLLCLCTAHIRPFAQGDDRYKRLAVILIAERTLIQRLLGPSEIVDSELSFHRIGLSFALCELFSIVINVVQVVLESAPVTS
jgi:hypothetical protein